MNLLISLLLLLPGCHRPDAVPPGDDSAPGPVSCAEGELLDGDACVPTACGVGTWGNLLVDGNTVYVNAAAAVDGDGSGAAPLKSIQAGVDLAGDRGGGLVAVAAGTYVEVIAMDSGHDGVTLAGRCKELVVIDGSEGGKEDPALAIIGGRKMPEIGVEGVTVTEGRYTGVWVDQATVSVLASDLRANAMVGITATNAGVTLDDVGVYDTQPDRAGHWGFGIDMELGATLTATGCTVQGNTYAGVYAANDGTVVDLVGTVILDTAPSPDGTFGVGIGVLDGASLAATGCTVQGSTQGGLYAANAGTVVELADTVILDTAASADGAGWGIGVEDGATLTATGCTVQESTEAGLYAAGAGTSVEVADTKLLDTAPGPDGTFGRGIAVELGASLTATGCTVQGNSDSGVFAANAGTSVRLTDTDILDTVPSPSGALGRGIEVQDGATLTATRCTIQGNTDAAVFAGHVGTVVELTDTAMLDTAPSPDGTLGRGINVQDGATLRATGCTVRGNTDIGVFAASAGTLAELRDTTILDTAPSPDGTGGYGIAVQDGASLTATGCTVEGNTALGVSAGSVGTVVELDDTEILATGASPDGTGGRGIGVQDGASLSATRCIVQGSAGLGVFAGSAGTIVDLVETAILDTSPDPDGTGGRGIAVEGGASLSATRCTIQGNKEVGVYASDAGTGVDLADTEILQTAQRPDGMGGRGVEVNDGASLTATRCTLRDNTEIGVLASDAGTVVDLADTAILDTHRGRTTGFALGANTQSGAWLSMSDTEISGTEGPGIYLARGARIDAARLTLTGNTFAGALITDGTLTVTASTITGTLADAEWGGGFGVYASGNWGAPTIKLVDSTIGAHDYAAVWLDGPGSYDLEGNTLSGSAGVDDHGTAIHGNAVFAQNGVSAWGEDATTGLLLADNSFNDASEIGVLLHDASAALTGNAWSGNGTDLRQQLCDGPDHVHGDVTSDDGTVTNDDAVPVTTTDLAGVPNPLVCPAANVLISSILFTTLYLPEMETDP